MVRLAGWLVIGLTTVVVIGFASAHAIGIAVLVAAGAYGHWARAKRG